MVKPQYNRTYILERKGHRIVEVIQEEGRKKEKSEIGVSWNNSRKIGAAHLFVYLSLTLKKDKYGDWVVEQQVKRTLYETQGQE